MHGKAAATIHRRVREFFGGDPTPQQLLSVPDEPLRAAGVSGNKIKALNDLAAKTLDGTVPSHAAILKMPDADIVERLTEVRGIGSWTVEMLLIFRLGRPDVLPVTDYGVRKGLCADVSEGAEVAAGGSGGSAEAGCAVSGGDEVGAVSVGGELVSVAGLRSGEGRSTEEGRGAAASVVQSASLESQIISMTGIFHAAE